MKKMILIVSVVVSVFLFSFKMMEPVIWTVDKAHARLTFTVTHMMVSDVEGSFRIFNAKVITLKDDFSDAQVDFSADASSVNTDNDQRDEHVKSAEFLEVTKYPVITFKSTSFKKVNGNAYKVTGNLTIHGVTKPVILTAVARTGINPMSKKPIAGFKITGTIKRSDYGVGTKFPVAVLSDEIAIAANAEFGKN
ncbi:YceI family protein [Pedobacter cryoconitis]|uniref:Polyisoprenoid-binding protein YceI n=1 Tax=Pedobacter cryoconitis TaxID=188932 RepID=A0A7X0J1F5_9SPHI|nr:YceI family protein [Pedobacter cryoconitis]MBB6499330.1 polyisoprenoid-binding protein YceI [Pedobacter cryoconitis]